MEKITLTAKEAAQFLVISYWHILDLANQGEIPHNIIGKRKYFRKEVLIKYLDNNCQRD